MDLKNEIVNLASLSEYGEAPSGKHHMDREFPTHRS
jgi:hypothetical protein